MKREKKPAESKIPKAKPPARRSSPTAKTPAPKQAETTPSARKPAQPSRANTPDASAATPQKSSKRSADPASARIRKSPQSEPTSAPPLAQSPPLEPDKPTPLALSTEATPSTKPPILSPKSPKRPVKPGAARQLATPKQSPLNIPPILLEGDLPPAPKIAGPGTRYALAAPVPQPHPGTPEKPGASATLSELPESYGTQRLFLAARDPRWLYASWDLALEQQRAYNQRSREGHLVLRVYAADETSPVVPDVHVNPESRNFFINVPKPETRYWAELGYYARTGTWVQITKSQSTFTPPDAPAPEAAAEFATIPVQVSFEQVVKTVQEFVTGHQPLLEAVIAAQAVQKEEAQTPTPTRAPASAPASPAFELAPERHAETPAQPNGAIALSEPASPPDIAPPEPRKRARRARAEIPIRVERAEPWTPERREALARLISIDSYRRVWMGSIEITELVRRQLQEEIASITAAELAGIAGEAAGPGAPLLNISSPLGGEGPRRDRKFWFKVNAELIIYGATEPDARVTIADRPVKLRPDGTFSFRFALPDGRYGLPATATSADGIESREAALEFSRATEYRGQVGAHPQEPGLRSPRPENL